MRVLVRKDDGELAEAIAAGLRLEGMAVDTALDGDAALDRALVNDYDVIVLDRDLPGVHGDEVCAKLADKCRARILLLTAAGTIANRVAGLGRGADDYLPKPFGFAELIARIRALGRRSHPAVPPVLIAKGVALDPAPAARHPVRQVPRPWTQGAGRPRTAHGGGRPRGVRRGTARARLGRDGRSAVQHGGEGHGQPAAAQARPAAGDRDRRPGRVPHMRRGSVRLRLTVLFGALFLAAGAALLAITYGMVSHATNGIFVSSANAGGGAGSAAGGAPAALPSTDPLQAQATRIAGTAKAAENDALLLYSGIALAIMAVVSMALGWFAAGRALRPLRRITAAAQRISATNLHERLAVGEPDDDLLANWADTIDDLFGRLDAVVRRAATVRRQRLARTAHAAGPLADHARSRAPGPRRGRRVAARHLPPGAGRRGRTRAAARGAADTRAGTARPRPPRYRRPRRHHRDVLAARGAEIAASGLAMAVTLEPALLAGDRALTERGVANLIDNALRHNVPGGAVWVAVGTGSGQAVLTVANTGPDVPPAEVGRLLVPFERGGTAPSPRARPPASGEGLGLGLPIVQAIAAAHGAALTVAARPDGGGLTAGLAFPAADPARSAREAATAADVPGEAHLAAAALPDRSSPHPRLLGAVLDLGPEGTVGAGG